MQQPKWLEWAQTLQTLSQNGLAYCKNPFDIERFEAVRRIASEILSTYSEMDHGSLEGLFTGEIGYATPKVDVRGAVFRDGKILLVRENMDAGRWTLPGGWADVNDTPSQAVEREIREESGFEARAVKLAALYDRNTRGHPYMYFSTYKLFFLCDLTGGAATAPNLETGGADFFTDDALPELSLSRVTPEEIHMLFKHYQNPDLPTEFD